MDKYIVKTPVKNFTGVSWGLAFVGGKSVEFEDKILFDKLVKKGYTGEVISAEKRPSKKELVEKATELGIDVTGLDKVAELQKAIDDHLAAQAK